MKSSTIKQLMYYHANIPGNPWKNGIVNVSIDVPAKPIMYRSEEDWPISR